MVLAEGTRTSEASHFSYELQKFRGNPSVPRKEELARQYPSYAHELHEIWRAFPKEERTRELLLVQFQKRFGDLKGHHELNARPQDHVPAGDWTWNVADTLLGGSYKGGTEQPLTVDVKGFGMRIISEWGHRAIDLSLIPGEERPLVVFDTANFHTDETNYANEVIRKIGVYPATEMLMNVAGSLLKSNPALNRSSGVNSAA